MTYQDIETLITKKEGNSLEFKESTGQLDRSMETLCAFLNGEGGTILYGVRDDGRIIGQTVSDSTKRSIAEALNRIEPFVDLEIIYITIPDTEKYVIVIFVEEQCFMRPFTYKGRAYLRIESTTTVMPQERYNHLLMERGGKYGWEAMINPDLKIADLDENAILGAVREGIRNGRTQQVPNKYPTSIQQVHELVSIMNDNEYSVKEIMSILNLKDRVNFLRNYLTPALDEGLVSMKFPEQPKHPKQKYLLTSKGKAILSE